MTSAAQAYLFVLSNARGTPALRLSYPTAREFVHNQTSVVAGFLYQRDVLFGQGADAVHVAGGDGVFFDEC